MLKNTKILGCALGCVVLLSAGQAASVTSRSAECQRAEEGVSQTRQVLSHTTRDKDVKAASLYTCLQKNKRNRAACKGAKRAYETAQSNERDARCAFKFAVAKRDRACR